MWRKFFTLKILYLRQVTCTKYQLEQKIPKISVRILLYSILYYTSMLYREIFTKSFTNSTVIILRNKIYLLRWQIN